MQDGLKGAYLCQQCDNVVFSGWENDFKKVVFDLVQEGKPGRWTGENSIRFLLAVAFRYMVHFLETSPSEANRQRNLYFRDLLRQALEDLTLLNLKLFLYPYQYRPIIAECGFLPGINHFLQLGFHCQSLAAEGNLPQALLLYLPGMMILFTDGDLSFSKSPNFPNPISLVPSSGVDFSNANLTMPQFLLRQLNQAVGQATGHQKGMKMWKFEWQQDKIEHPSKKVYTAYVLDSELRAWQKENCPQQS